MDHEVKTNVECVVRFLMTTASFIQKGGLEKLKSLDPRFQTAECFAVIAKQWKEVDKASTQLVQHYDTTSGVRAAAARIVTDYAQMLCTQFAIKPPVKSETEFLVKRGSEFLSTYNLRLSAHDNKKTRVILCSMDQRYAIHSFWIRELLCAIELFGAMMTTLCVQTPFPAYERFVASKMIIQGWFTNGHPYDMLVHDVEDLRNASKIGLVAIYTEPDRCSTQALTNGVRRTESKTLLVTAA